MTKAGLFYHNIMHLLKNKKNTHIRVSDSPPPPIQQEEDNKKHYTICDVNMADCARLFHHINGQPVKIILHEVDNIILYNIPIPREDARMSEEIYLPSVPHFQGKIFRQKVQHVEPIILPNLPKGILDRQKKLTL